MCCHFFVLVLQLSTKAGRIASLITRDVAIPFCSIRFLCIEILGGGNAHEIHATS
jgi:hypothetical protein